MNSNPLSANFWCGRVLIKLTNEQNDHPEHKEKSFELEKDEKKLELFGETREISLEYINKLKQSQKVYSKK
jgi:hypothetical protein